MECAQLRGMPTMAAGAIVDLGANVSAVSLGLSNRNAQGLSYILNASLRCGRSNYLRRRGRRVPA